MRNPWLSGNMLSYLVPIPESACTEHGGLRTPPAGDGADQEDW